MTTNGTSNRDGTSSQTATFASAARAARTLVLLTVAEAGVVLAYLAVTETDVLSARYLAYPFVWTNAAVLAVAYAPVPRPRLDDRWTLGAAGLAVGYFLTLCVAGGLASAGNGTGLGSVSVLSAVPGWGPLVTLSGGVVHLSLVPFKLVGYAGLATLAYAALARASRSLLGGALGLVTCVSCTGSVLGTLLAGVLGGSSVAASAALSQSYDLSTAIFLVALGALWFGVRR
jgi:hypothetical protein